MTPTPGRIDALALPRPSCRLRPVGRVTRRVSTLNLGIARKAKMTVAAVPDRWARAPIEFTPVKSFRTQRR